MNLTPLEEKPVSGQNIEGETEQTEDETEEAEENQDESEDEPATTANPAAPGPSSSPPAAGPSFSPDPADLRPPGPPGGSPPSEDHGSPTTASHLDLTLSSGSSLGHLPSLAFDLAKAMYTVYSKTPELYEVLVQMDVDEDAWTVTWQRVNSVVS